MFIWASEASVLGEMTYVASLMFTGVFTIYHRINKGSKICQDVTDGTSRHMLCLYCPNEHLYVGY